MRFFRNSAGLIFSSIFSLIVMVLLACSLFRYFTGVDHQIISFSSFLEILQNYPLAFRFEVLQELSFDVSWGVFDFLRTIVNTLITPIRWGIFMCANAINSVIFIMYFITNLLFI